MVAGFSAPGCSYAAGLSLAAGEEHRFKRTTTRDTTLPIDGVEVQYLSVGDAIAIGELAWNVLGFVLDVTGQWGAELAAAGHPGNPSLEGS
ncbi:MAG TPA: hypothetical protein VGF45_01830 [Polyangia bacterium]